MWNEAGQRLVWSWRLTTGSFLLALEKALYNVFSAIARKFRLGPWLLQLQGRLQEVLADHFVGRYVVRASGPSIGKQVLYSFGNSVLDTHFELPHSYRGFPFEIGTATPAQAQCNHLAIKAVAAAQRGHLAMMASKLSYEHPAIIQDVTTGWGFKWLTTQRVEHPEPETPNTYWFIIYNANAAIVTFRGTEPLSLIDIATDFRLGPTCHPNMGQVHEGFYKALLEPEPLERTFSADPGVNHQTTAFDGLLEALNKPEVEHKPIYVFGHSLGGALAAVFVQALLRSQEFAAVQDRIAGVITGGEPRVGDSDFAAIFDAAYGRIATRYVHAADIVPKVPFPNMGFCHHTGMLFATSWHIPGEPRFVGVGEGAEWLDAAEAWLGFPLAPVKILASLLCAPRETILRTATRCGLVLLPGISDHLQDNYERVTRENVRLVTAANRVLPTPPQKL